MNLLEEVKWLRERVIELEEQNQALQNVIDNYIIKTSEEYTITIEDSISEYEEWLDSPQGDKLVQAYEDYFNTQEVAVEEETQYSEDAKDRMAQSHLWL